MRYVQKRNGYKLRTLSGLALPLWTPRPRR